MAGFPGARPQPSWGNIENVRFLQAVYDFLIATGGGGGGVPTSRQLISTADVTLDGVPANTVNLTADRVIGLANAGAGAGTYGGVGQYLIDETLDAKGRVTGITAGNLSTAVTTIVTPLLGTKVFVGTATLDFGAFPGASDASVAVTGQTGILAGSSVLAWIFPIATADHSADEHLLDTLEVAADTVVAGTGFTIRGYNSDKLGDTRLYGTWNIGWRWI